MNTKFEQDFSLLPKGQFTETRRPLVSVVTIIAFALAVIGLSAWYFWPKNTLLARLPTDANLYFSVSLPAEERWYHKLLWWRPDELPQRAATAIFHQLIENNRQWHGINLSELMSVGRGQAEVAQLADNTWIFALELKEPKGLERSTLLAGLARARIGRRHYFSDKSDFWDKIRTKPKPSLGKINRYLGRGAASIYLKNSSPLAELDAPALSAAGNFLTYPFMLTAKTSGQGLIWQEFGQKGLLSSRAIALPIVGPTSEAALVWQFADLGAIINKALSYFSQENKELLGKLYNFNPADIVSKFADKQGLFILSDIAGPNWIFLVRENGQTAPNQEILQVFKDLAVSFFAATHPEAVEHQLIDGSKMVELRAERGNIVGQSFIKKFQGQEYKFWGLLGQGENTGYFVGFLPGQGYILTSNLGLLDILPNVFIGHSSASIGKDCFKGKKMAQAAWVRIKSHGNIPGDGDIIKLIGLSETAAGQLSGCVIF